MVPRAAQQDPSARRTVRGAPCTVERAFGVLSTMDRAPCAPMERASSGVMIRVSGNNAIFSPPLIVTSDNVTKILSAVETGLKAVSG